MSSMHSLDLVAERIRSIDSSSLRHAHVAARGVISLASGDPAPLAPEPVIGALAAAIAREHLSYAHPQGIPALREAIANEMSAAGVEDASAEDIVVTHGATGGIAATCLGLLDPGDRAVLVTPTYSLYADAIRLAGAEPVFVPARAPFRLPLDRLADALVRAKLLFVCNPSNPTGAIVPRDDLVALANLLERTGTLLVVDEAYASIVFTSGGFVSAANVGELRDRLVLLQTYSKRFCMTGLRVGYLWTNLPYVQALLRAHRTFAGPINAVGQQAVLRLLSEPRPWEADLLDDYRHRREVVNVALRSLPFAAYESPSATFFAFFRPDSRNSGETHVERLRRAGVLLRPGEEFGPGGEGYVRLAFCGDLDELKQALQRVTSYYTTEEDDP